MKLTEWNVASTTFAEATTTHHDTMRSTPRTYILCITQHINKNYKEMWMGSLLVVVIVRSRCPSVYHIPINWSGPPLKAKRTRNQQTKKETAKHRRRCWWRRRRRNTTQTKWGKWWFGNSAVVDVSSTSSATTTTTSRARTHAHVYPGIIHANIYTYIWLYTCIYRLGAHKIDRLRHDSQKNTFIMRYPRWHVWWTHYYV